MKNLRRLAAPLIAATLLAGCASTSHRIRTESLSPEWQGEPYARLLVIAVYEDHGYRVNTESVFAAKLTENAVHARTSYEEFPDLQALSSGEDLRRVLARKKYDAVLTVATIEGDDDFDHEAWVARYSWQRLLGSGGKKTKTEQFWGDGSDSAPGGAALDFALWDAETLEPVWHATTDSYADDERDRSVAIPAEYVRVTLKARGLL